MDVFDRRWKNHVVKIEKYWKKKVTEQDTVVITGDHSWGRNLEECQADLDFIMALPGRKILLRGNHDMFWDAKKTEKLNEMFRGKLEFLQNNFYTYEDLSLIHIYWLIFQGILPVLCGIFQMGQMLTAVFPKTRQGLEWIWEVMTLGVQMVLMLLTKVMKMTATVEAAQAA